MIPKFYGEIAFGKLTMEDQDTFDAHLCSMFGRVEVSVKRYNPKRTLSQNQYYWGVVIRMISDETGHSPEEIHETMKIMFLRDIIKINDEVYETVKSTTNLDTREFSKDYIDRIKSWAFDTLNLIIPEANDVN